MNRVVLSRGFILLFVLAIVSNVFVVNASSLAEVPSVFAEVPATISFVNYYTYETISTEVAGSGNLPEGVKYFLSNDNDFITAEIIDSISTNTVIYCVPENYSMPYYDGNTGAELGKLNLTANVNTLAIKNGRFVSIKYGSTETLTNSFPLWANSKGQDLGNNVLYGDKAYRYYSNDIDHCEVFDKQYIINRDVLTQEVEVPYSEISQYAKYFKDMQDILANTKKTTIDLKAFTFDSTLHQKMLSSDNGNYPNYMNPDNFNAVVYGGNYFVAMLSNEYKFSGVFIVSIENPRIACCLYYSNNNNTLVFSEPAQSTVYYNTDARNKIKEYNDDLVMSIDEQGIMSFETPYFSLTPKNYDWSAFADGLIALFCDGTAPATFIFNQRMTKYVMTNGIGHDFSSSVWEDVTNSITSESDLKALCNGADNSSDVVLPKDFSLLQKVEKAFCCRDTSLCISEKPYAVRITEKSVAPTITITGTDTILTEESIDFIGRLVLDVSDVNRDISSIVIDGVEKLVKNTESTSVTIEADDLEHTIVATDKLGNVTTGKVLTVTHVPSIVELSAEEPVTEVTGDFIFKVFDKKDDVASVTDNGKLLQSNDAGFYAIRADNQEHTIDITDNENNTARYVVTIKLPDDSVQIYIPKRIHLETDTDGLSYGEYCVDVDGFLQDGKAVVVQTNSELVLKQAGKENKTAKVTQQYTVFYGENFTGAMVTKGKIFSNQHSIDSDCIGSISVNDLSAGSWNGEIVFNVDIVTADGTEGSMLSNTNN